MRKDLAPSRDSAIPRICKHAINRPNSLRDRPRSVEPDYLASIAVLMCKRIKMHAERLSCLPHNRSGSWRGMVILSVNRRIAEEDVTGNSKARELNPVGETPHPPVRLRNMLMPGLLGTRRHTV